MLGDRDGRLRHAPLLALPLLPELPLPARLAHEADLPGHPVEDLAHPLHPAVDGVEFAGGVPGVVTLHSQRQLLPHRGPRDLLARVRGFGRVKGREG